MIRANCFRLDIVLQRHHTSLGDISAHSLCVFSDFHTFYYICFNFFTCIVVVTLDGIQASIVANNASIVNLEASVDTLVTETISGLKSILSKLTLLQAKPQTWKHETILKLSSRESLVQTAMHCQKPNQISTPSMQKLTKQTAAARQASFTRKTGGAKQLRSQTRTC